MSEVTMNEAVARHDGFYFYLSLWMCCIALVGFVPGFFGERADPSVTQNIAVHIHAVVYFGWLVAVAYQMRLPGRGKIVEHRRLGQWLLYYGCAIVVFGLWVTFSRFADRVEMGDMANARMNMLPPFSDMLLFPVLFGLAIGYRRRPDLHKRFMILACCSLLIAGVGRMRFLGSPPSLLVFNVIWLSPIWIAMIRDLVVDRRLHPVYGIGILLMAAMPFRMALVDADFWQQFTNWLAPLVS